MEKNTKLKQYLEKNYSKGSSNFCIILLVFTNDYNRLLNSNYAGKVCELNKKIYEDCFMKEMTGFVRADLFTWLQWIDKQLADLIEDKEDFIQFRAYFQVEDIYRSPDNIYKILYPESAKQIQDAITEISLQRRQE